MSAPHAPNSRKWMLSKQMLAYCTEILRRLGRDFTRCELCGGSTDDHPELHHARYDGATISDMQIACRSCNRLAVNRGKGRYVKEEAAVEPDSYVGTEGTVSYYRPDQRETADAASVWAKGRKRAMTLRDIAEAIAEDQDNGAWESTWPCEFAIVVEGRGECRFSVERYVEPVFAAYPVKPKAEAWSKSTHDNGASVNPEYEKALDAAIDAAWVRYKDIGARYNEGYADGLEAAMRMWERAQDATV